MQVLDINPEEEEEIEGANVDLDSQRKGKSVVIKTTTRQTYFLPVAGLVEPEKLKPGDLVGVNKVSCPYIWFMRSTTFKEFCLVSFSNSNVEMCKMYFNEVEIRDGNPNPESAQFLANFVIGIRNPFFNSGFRILIW